MQSGFRDLIFISVLLGMVAGTYAMVVQPHAKARQQRLADVRSMDRQISSVAASTAGLEEMKRRLEQQQQSMAFFTARLPGQPEVQKQISEVIETATANSLQAGEVITMKDTVKNGVDARPVHVEFTGNFNGIYSFLLQLEAMPRIMRISKLELSGDGCADQQVKAEMTLTMYFLPDSVTVTQAN